MEDVGTRVWKIATRAAGVSNQSSHCIILIVVDDEQGPCLPDYFYPDYFYPAQAHPPS
jgi:hypothetical protein